MCRQAVDTELEWNDQVIHKLIRWHNFTLILTVFNFQISNLHVAFIIMNQLHNNKRKSVKQITYNTYF